MSSDLKCNKCKRLNHFAGSQACREAQQCKSQIRAVSDEEESQYDEEIEQLTAIETLNKRSALLETI